MTSPAARAFRRLGYRSSLHYTLREAADFFGIGRSQFIKMLNNPDITPTPPTAMGTRTAKYYLKGDIQAMVEMFPYWAKRRHYAMTDYNGLHRINLSKVTADQLPLPLPTPTPTPAQTRTAKPAPAPVAPSANVSMIEMRLAGVQLATTKFGMSLDAATQMAKSGLFDA